MRCLRKKKGAYRSSQCTTLITRTIGKTIIYSGTFCGCNCYQKLQQAHCSGTCHDVRLETRASIWFFFSTKYPFDRFRYWFIGLSSLKGPKPGPEPESTIDAFWIWARFSNGRYFNLSVGINRFCQKKIFGRKITGRWRTKMFYDMKILQKQRLYVQRIGIFKYVL